MSSKTFWIVLIGIAILSWLDVLGDTTAMWLIAIFGAGTAGNYLEKRFDNLEDRIRDLENK